MRGSKSRSYRGGRNERDQSNEFTEAYSDLHRSTLIALGFLLFVVTFIVLAIAKLMLLHLARREGNA